MKTLFCTMISLTTIAFLLFGGAAMAKEVDWTALNPGFQGATYVKDASVCWGCHDESQEAFDHTIHAREFQFGETPAAGECESCHGPRSRHIDSPGRELALTPVQQGDACLQCHQGGNRIYWQSGAHKTAGVSCSDCHSMMEKKSDQAQLSAADEETLCYSCHTDVRAQMNKAYHHPLREGQMSCSDCHNVHGSAGQSLLKGATINETCFTCHQEKRGPFIWEHAPVRENCANCHDVHGSNQRDLLNSKGAFLCLQCHSYGGHINLPRYNRTSNPIGQGCVNCHMTQHGSNSPSGAKFTR
jgi:DmsE family decaheme c-type cytochrome